MSAETLDDRIAARHAALLWRIAAERLPMLPGSDALPLVTADVAAVLLDRSPRTLENWRTAGTGPAFYRTQPPSYRVLDLARHLERAYSAFP